MQTIEQREQLLAAAEPMVQFTARKTIRTYRVPFAFDDLAQELRIRIWILSERFDPDRSKWSTFLGRRMTYLAWDILRAKGYVDKRGRQRNEITALDDAGLSLFGLVADDSRGFEEVDWSDLVDVVVRESSGVRAMVLYCSGLTMSETASRLGVSESRVSQMINPNSRDRPAILDRIRYLIEGHHAT